MREKKMLERIEYIRKAILALPIFKAQKEITRIYALELLKDLEERVQDYNVEDFLDNNAALRRDLLNGAKTWEEYSYGGCSLICTEDIRARFQYTTVKNPDDLLKEQAIYLKKAFNLIERINHRFI